MNQNQDKDWFDKNPERMFRVREKLPTEKLNLATEQTLALVKRGSSRVYISTRNDLHIDMTDEMLKFVWNSFKNSRRFVTVNRSDIKLLPPTKENRGLRKIKNGGFYTQKG